MKKIGLLAMALIILYGFTVWADAPAPFEYAKKYAMEMTKSDSDGNYICEFRYYNEDGKQIFIGIGYLVKQGIILLGKSDLGIIAYHEINGTFSTAYGGLHFEVKRDKAIEFAYVIYRELVRRNLLSRRI